jgi:hypothetical protein
MKPQSVTGKIFIHPGLKADYEYFLHLQHISEVSEDL